MKTLPTPKQYLRENKDRVRSGSHYLSGLMIIKGDSSDCCWANHCGYEHDLYDYGLRSTDLYAYLGKLARLYRRWRQFRDYITEVKPGWRVVRRIYRMDNSTAEIQISNDGRTRGVEICAGGDTICW